MHWAFVENILDIWQTIIYKAAGGQRISLKMSLMVSAKIEFLEKCFFNIDALAPYANEAKEIIEILIPIAKTRNTVAHSRPSLVNEDKGTITFQKLELINKRTIHRTSNKTIALKQIYNEAEECERLHPRMLDLTNRLMEQFMNDSRA